MDKLLKTMLKSKNSTYFYDVIIATKESVGT